VVVVFLDVARKASTAAEARLIKALDAWLKSLLFHVTACDKAAL
jgi:hypothetical protein